MILLNRMFVTINFMFFVYIESYILRPSIQDYHISNHHLSQKYLYEKFYIYM